MKDLSTKPETIGDLSERIAGLSPAKRALLEIRLKKKRTVAAGGKTIARSINRDSAPLSFSQQRLWFLDQLEPNSALYNIPKAARLSGSLNAEALKKSLAAIVERHEALRTTFVSVDGNPAQVINKNPCVELATIDLSAYSEGDRILELQRLLREEAQRPFNLSSDLMLRSTLLRLAQREHVLLLVMHHIAADGWSMGVLFRDLTALYEGFCNGKPSPLPELPIQYADFATWQRQHLQGKTLDTQLSYWKNQLAGAPFIIDLADRPRPAVQTHRGGTQSFTLSRSLSKRIQTLSRQEGVTLYMTLLAAFNVFLYRYTGQDDLVVGSPTAGRNRPEIEGLIGFFVNTLVLRTDLSGDVTFKELLGRVRTVTLNAFAHQDLPFEKLVEVMHPKRDAGHRSLVQVAFAFQNAPREPLKLQGLTVTPVWIDAESAKIDLTLFMWEAEDTLSGSLNYASDVFDPATITRMAEHFRSLLNALVTNPQAPITALPRFPEEEAGVTTFRTPRTDGLNVYASSNLTSNQLLIWAGQKLHPDVPLYNVINTYTIAGEIHRDHFQKAFQTLVNSSDALRTVIREVNGVPQQSVLESLPFEVEYLDFSQDAGPRKAFEIWLDHRRQLTFELSKRLFDCALAKISNQEYVWYLNQHHIITDGWSIALIFRKLSELYARSLVGRLEETLELPSFREYVRYEKEQRRSPRYLEIEAYWKTKLAEACEPLSFYGKTSLKETTRVRRISCDLGLERTQRLKRLAFSEKISANTAHASMFNVFAAVLAAYLYRITGNRRHSIGTPFHNRRSKDFRETLGLCMEVLPLRISVEENDTFMSLVRKIALEASEAFRFCCSIGNSPTNKIYDVLLNYHIGSVSTFNGIPVRKEWVHTGHENDSLAVQIHDFNRSGSMILDFDFHCDVFDDGERSRAIQHFLTILDALVENPTRPLYRARLLPEKERRQLLREFNANYFPLPNNLTLPQLFEEQVQRRPDQLAVSLDGASLTYAELNSRANQLANYLKSLGVGREMIVAICSEPSLALLVGIVGILKAGGAYLAFDPEHPAERLRFILRDANASVLLTEKRLLEQYPSLSAITTLDSGPRARRGSTRIVYLDADWSTIAQASVQNPANNLTADNSAYAIYTSGSTGTAKGVVVQHGGICNRLLWAQKFYRLSETDRCLQKASFSYDASVWEIFEPLLAGARIVMARPGGRQDSAYLVDLIVKHKITVAEFVPSMLRLVLEETAVDRCRSLKRVFSGGEVLPLQVQKSFFEKLSADLHNTYGPTEASVDVTHWKCTPDSDEQNIPIGRAIGNTAIYVLDRHLNPLPIGMAGELHIGGIGLARGYLNQPELTAEKFIPNPFGREPGSRMYKTGDLARYRPDGNIEFLGRLDHQVKMRGLRIELGEIESVLGCHPAVREAVVLAREEAAGDKRLAAYVVPQQGVALDVRDLRIFLKEMLPAHMIPSRFVSVDALPLNPNGKLDRNALPAPDGSRPDLVETFIGPRTATEEALAGIWAALLGVDKVGIRDNFFDLGGHSLLAVRLFAEIEKTFSKRPPLASLFQQATIEHLAHLLGQNNSLPASLVPVQPEGSKAPFFCVHEFFGDVFCYMNLARHLGPDQPFYALQPRGLDGAEEPFETVESMAAYYIDLIRAVQPEGPYALGGLCFGGVIAFEMAQQLRAKGESVAVVALLDSAVGSGTSRPTWWWRFLRNLPRNLPSWLHGSLQLTQEQWSSVIKIKMAMAKLKLSSAFRSSATASRQDVFLQRIKQLGDVFHFSERHHRVARAQYRALTRYKPQTYGGPLTLFRARMQPFFSSHDPAKGWKRLACGGLDIRVIPGNHLGMLQEPHVRVLAKELTACLAKTTKTG